LAKDRKPLPTVADVDATDRAALGGTYIPNKGTPKRSRRIIPGYTEISDQDGTTTISEHGPQVAGNIHHLTNPLLNRTAGMKCQANGPSGCEYPVTHFIRNKSRARESVLGMCTMHKGKAVHDALNSGEDLEIERATPRRIQDVKKMQSIEAEKTNLKVAGALYLKGVPKEDALAFNQKKTPGRPAHRRGGATNVAPSGSGAPLMNEVESAEYRDARLEQNKGKKSPMEGIDTFLESRGGPYSETEVKVGKKVPANEVDEDLPLGEGTGDIDHVLRLYRSGDPSWYSESKRLNIHPDLLQNKIPSPPSRTVNAQDVDKLLYSERPERLTTAIKNVAEDQAEQVIEAHTQNKYAEKMRAIQSRRSALPSSRPGLPSRRELPSRRQLPFNQGQQENKGLE
jgi:hypothetical protein